MNDSDFEDRLRLLVPAGPSPELEERIALALETRLATLPRAVPVPAVAVLRRGSAQAPAWLRLLRGTGWAAAGAAAGVAVMWYFHPPSAGVAAAASLFEPAESAREAVSTQEEGTVYSEAHEPARLVRYTSIERHAWTNPTTGAWVRVEVPREDIVALPVSYQ